MALFLRLIVIFIGALALLAAVEWGVWRSSLPQTTGVVALDGPKAEITITRDQHGVPHIAASGDHDLNFALGYVHAQDRLFQMETNRRIGHGRLSELVGASALPIDRYMRTMGFSHLAANSFEALPDDGKAILQAYADGVNAFIRNHRGSWPPEYALLDVTPEPWTPLDTLVWQKIMWLDLSGNAGTEAARAQLLTKLGSDQVKTIFPDYPGEDNGPLPDFKSLYSESPLAAVTDVLPMKPRGYGSNNWVVSGALTKSGKPLLANDPHLGLTTPSIWYLVHLHDTTTGDNMVGVGFPGTPGVILGRNDHIAWGFTNTAPDIQDLFIEKMVGEDQYLTPDGPQAIKTRIEPIKVRFGDTVQLRVRTTRHGPIISDISANTRALIKPGYAVAMQWTALQPGDTGSYAVTRLIRARTFEDFKAAGQFYLGPEQNMIYADVDGNIGYYAPARVPIRHPDNPIRGRFPSPGWDALYDWQGYIPYEDLPTRYNPESGIIATANEKIVDDDYPYYITRDWALPYRGNRIRAELKARAPHDTTSFGALHMDTVSDFAREMLPVLRAALPDHEAMALLADWDGDMAADSAAALIFSRFNHVYHAALLNDQLGDLARVANRHLPRLISSSLRHSLGEDPAAGLAYALPPLDKAATLAWCDDITTEKTESCIDIAQQAMDETLASLRGELGGDPSAWAWGDLHILHQEHRPFSFAPGLRNLFGITTAIGGSRYTINVAGDSMSNSTRHESGFGPSYRGVFDLADVQNSRYVQPTGQSGHPLSPHHKDLFPLWRDGDYITIATDRDAIKGDVLTLKPGN